MKKGMLFVVFSSVMFFANALAYAAGPEDILGVWLNQEKDAKIEIFKCGEKYCGKVVWLKDPNYPEGSKDGKVYDPKNGKTYSGKMTLVSPTELHLRGFIGISLIGRTAVWTRE
jgi:uncharacterized protein (DUF2147 family)